MKKSNFLVASLIVLLLAIGLALSGCGVNCMEKKGVSL